MQHDLARQHDVTLWVRLCCVVCVSRCSVIGSEKGVRPPLGLGPLAPVLWHTMLGTAVLGLSALALGSGATANACVSSDN